MKVFNEIILGWREMKKGDLVKIAFYIFITEWNANQLIPVNNLFHRILSKLNRGLAGSMLIQINIAFPTT